MNHFLELLSSEGGKKLAKNDMKTLFMEKDSKGGFTSASHGNIYAPM